MKLYEYAIIFNPHTTKEQKDRGETAKSELLVPITTLQANDDKAAQTLASRAIPEKYLTQLDRVDIAIRPF